MSENSDIGPPESFIKVNTDGPLQASQFAKVFNSAMSELLESIGERLDAQERRIAFLERELETERRMRRSMRLSRGMPRD